jgi:hypothetical protein
LHHSRCHSMHSVHANLRSFQQPKVQEAAIQQSLEDILTAPLAIPLQSPLDVHYSPSLSH